MPCWYCGTSLKGGKRTRDHVEPKSKVGNKTRFVDACGPCNVMKAALTLDEFRFLYFGHPPWEFWGEIQERLHRLI